MESPLYIVIDNNNVTFILYTKYVVNICYQGISRRNQTN